MVAMDKPAAAPPLAHSADRELRHLAALTGRNHGISGAQLLMERAQLAGMRFAPGTSAGGSCRLLATRDHTLAVNLPRDADWTLIPAWLETEAAEPWNWARLAGVLAHRHSAQLVERARLLGLAVASTGAAAWPASQDTRGWQVVQGTPLPSGPPASSRPVGRPRVVDLSGLWAGPLASHLLYLAGAEVIKVESTRRPDGARSGNPEFYRLLNQGKRSVALDLAVPQGQRVLLRLLAHADIVIESSRPRALRQMDIFAESLVHGRKALTWISINGYGRLDPEANWIAFGDDAGVAAGLSDIMKAAVGHYQFAGDAIADPLTGIRAARLAYASWLAGGSRLLALSLAGTAASSLRDELAREGGDAVTAGFANWWHQVQFRQTPPGVAARPVTGPVRALGADTGAVLEELGIPC